MYEGGEKSFKTFHFSIIKKKNKERKIVKKKGA